MSNCTGCQNLSNLTHQGTREMCRIVQDVWTCLIWHTKGPGKCVRLYRMSEYSCFILVNRNTFGPYIFVGCHGMSKKFRCPIAQVLLYFCWFVLREYISQSIDENIFLRASTHRKRSLRCDIVCLSKFCNVTSVMSI